ncbi:uncharacterized protein KY384_006275 [Bacidia gigantensis]|uniref:uncharacterized protein n=1 Tax=Bacidia gigantensis TaxID=2732470 RepID=UPI001D049A79|nr:uncharacterized protein KY384_006275 [Bacidia gigantensis]KAG8528588.1 hypothetical protein KY384_006275 [Bacidia gigantensis]
MAPTSFLSLPAEIRHKIYEFTFTTDLGAPDPYEIIDYFNNRDDEFSHEERAETLEAQAEEQAGFPDSSENHETSRRETAPSHVLSRRIQQLEQYPNLSSVDFFAPYPRCLCLEDLANENSLIKKLVSLTRPWSAELGTNCTFSMSMKCSNFDSSTPEVLTYRYFQIDGTHADLEAFAETLSSEAFSANLHIGTGWDVQRAAIEDARA